MGKPMVRNILKAGYREVLVWNRSSKSMEEVVADGAIASTPREIGETCDVVITMLPNSPQVKEVMLGETGVAAYMKPGAVFIDCSSINPVASQEIAAVLAARGVDIPVKHLSNCGIILDSPEYHQDMIRFGSMVFGSYSSNEVCKARVQLKDAFALRAEVACVKELAPGEGVGYDLAFIAQRPTRIAVLPLGYADMICLRRLKNKG